MATLASLNVAIGLKLDRFYRDVNELNRGIGGLGRELATVGAGLTAGITAPIVALGAVTLNTAGDFEAAMNRVEAKANATEDEIAALTQTARDLGATTQFSASEAASGLEFLAQAGFNAQQQLAALPGVLDAAAANNVSLGRSADVVSNVLSQFRLEAEETTRVVDVLTATTTTSNTNFDQLAEAFNYLGPTAAAFGVSIEESAAAVGILGNSGLQGSLATRALGTALVNLTKPTKAAAETMEQLGLNFFDAQGEFVGLAGTIEQLQGAFVGLTQQQQQEALAKLFGGEAIQEFNILLTSGADSLRDYTSELEESGGTAARVAGVQMEGLNGALKTLSSAFEELQLVVADSGLLDFAGSIVAGITSVVRGIGQLDPAILRAVTVVAGLAAAIGPLVLGFGGLLAVIPSVTAGAAALGIALGPIGLAIAGLAAAAALLAANWDRVVAVFQSDAIQQAIAPLRELFERFGATIRSVFEQVVAVVRNALGLVVGIVRLQIGAALAIWNAFGDDIVNVVSFAFELVGRIVGDVLRVVAGILGAFGALVRGDWAGVWESLRDAAATILNGLIDIVAGQMISLSAIVRQGLSALGIGEGLQASLAQGEAAIQAFADRVKIDLPKKVADGVEETKALFEGLGAAISAAVGGGNGLPTVGTLSGGSAQQGAASGLSPADSVQGNTSAVTIPVKFAPEPFDPQPVVESLTPISETLDTISTASLRFGEVMVNTIGQAVSAAISGAQSFAESARQIIKALISQGIAAVIANSLKEASGFLGPLALPIAAAAGAGASALFDRLIPSFATGGVAYGPQLAMIGDNPGRREYIIPSEIMDKIGPAGGGTVDVNVHGVISGRNLELVQEKNTYRNARVS